MRGVLDGSAVGDEVAIMEGITLRPAGFGHEAYMEPRVTRAAEAEAEQDGADRETAQKARPSEEGLRTFAPDSSAVEAVDETPSPSVASIDMLIFEAAEPSMHLRAMVRSRSRAAEAYKEMMSMQGGSV